MPTFVHVIDKHKGMTLDYGFVLKIDGIIDLMNYVMCVKNTQMVNAFSEYLNSKEFDYLTKQGYSGKNHCITPTSFCLSVLSRCETLKEKPRSVIELLSNLMEKTVSGMMNVIDKYGTIYIQRSGGYFSHSDTISVGKTVNQDTYDYPGVDRTIKINQWPNGTHWYARVGEFDISDNEGNYKWNTREEAINHTKPYLIKNNIPIPKEFT